MRPPGKATWASRAVLRTRPSAVACPASDWRCKTRISARDVGSLTQSCSKNSDKDGGGAVGPGSFAVGAGTTRMRRATAALLGSGRDKRSTRKEKTIDNGWRTGRRRCDHTRGGGAYALKSSSKEGGGGRWAVSGHGVVVVVVRHGEERVWSRVWGRGRRHLRKCIRIFL